ncbi:unnamed protein product, partial [Ilex paraguariensis]
VWTETGFFGIRGERDVKANLGSTDLAAKKNKSWGNRARTSNQKSSPNSVSQGLD